MAAKTDWPYDARRDDPLTALRIPVTTFAPGWRYLVAFDGVPLPGEAGFDRPTGAEALMLASYIDYVRSCFSDRTAREMAAKPLDVFGGWNTEVFHKWGPDDWGYRRSSYVTGPLFFPAAAWMEREAGPFTLVGLMDRVYSYGGSYLSPHGPWAQWKAAHPDVFPAVEAVAGGE